MEKLFYYCHLESDCLFISLEIKEDSYDEELTKLGECKKRSLRELVNYIYEISPDSWIFALITDELIINLKLKI